MKINFRVRSSPRLRTPKYDIHAVADALSESQYKRILSGYNVLDQPSKPLSLAYARKKVRSGALAIRNWLLSFDLMRSFGIQSEGDRSITIGWPKNKQDKVRWNEKHDHMAGISPRDRQAGIDAARGEFLGDYIRGMWMTKRK